jgi:hypothetical protein
LVSSLHTAHTHHTLITPFACGAKMHAHSTANKFSMLGRVSFMVGHDDDTVLDPSVPRQGRGADLRTSSWAGMQSDMAIVNAVQTRFPQLDVSTFTTVEELIATDADVVVIISYKTQPSFAWYSTFFDALRALEERGVAVYPSADFKRTISSKAAYTKVLLDAGLPMCPTEILDRPDCVDASGALDASKVNERLDATLSSLGLLPSPCSVRSSSSSSSPSLCSSAGRPFYLVTKPSNADGGFGVAFWEGSTARASAVAPEPASEGFSARASDRLTDGGATENADVQHPSSSHSSSSATRTRADAAEAGRGTATTRSLLDSLKLRMMLTAGQAPDAIRRLADTDPAPSSSLGRVPTGGTGGGGGGDPAVGDVSGADSEWDFLTYLRTVGFVGQRPHLLLQPLVPLLAQHFEIKIYFLRRKVFFASLVYGKEKLYAKVVRPSTDADLFEYLEPLVRESVRALEALPSDGPLDPKILMRVDWGTGEPLLPDAEGGADGESSACGSDGTATVREGGGGGSGSDGGAFLKRVLVKRASSLGPPQKRLKRSMDTHSRAPLTGTHRHFINEVEIHPGYYVDWDETPDETIGPLADAYGEYLVQLLSERTSAQAGLAS